MTRINRSLLIWWWNIPTLTGEFCPDDFPSAGKCRFRSSTVFAPSQVGGRSKRLTAWKIHMRDTIMIYGHPWPKVIIWSISTRVELVDNHVLAHVNWLNPLKPRVWWYFEEIDSRVSWSCVLKATLWQWGLSRVLALSRRGDRSIMEMDMFCFPYLKLAARKPQLNISHPKRICFSNFHNF